MQTIWYVAWGKGDLKILTEFGQRKIKTERQKCRLCEESHEVKKKIKIKAKKDVKVLGLSIKRIFHGGRSVVLDGV